MDRKRILQLLAKQLGHAASDKEITELKELLSRHPEYHFFNEILQSIEGEKHHREPVVEEKELVEEGWNLLQQGMVESAIAETPYFAFPRNHDRKSLHKIWIRRAAIWIGIIVLGGGSFFILEHKKAIQISMASLQMKQISLPYGAPQKKILPDSSVVWLNAGSHIRYAADFIQNKRIVYLQGEAYFDIKHDAAHPFIVHAGNIDIKVLGTEFNVQAYADENEIETTLINGKIQVQIAGNPDKKIILTPHEKLTVVNREFQLTGTEDRERKEMSFQVKEMPGVVIGSPIRELAWMQDKLAFQDERLGELAKKLDRRFNVHILFNDTLLENERLSGVFVNENIQKAMQILQMTTPFTYRIKNDTVYLNK